jgi:hypothetical protein
MNRTPAAAASGEVVALPSVDSGVDRYSTVSLGHDCTLIPGHDCALIDTLPA